MLEIDRYLNYVKLLKTQWLEAKAERDREEANIAEAKRIAQQQRERERKIDNLVRNARVLRAQHKYQQALDTVEEILSLDPNNSFANDNRDMIQQLVLLYDRKEADRTFHREEQRTMADIEWKMIPWFQELQFPRNWREIRKRAERYGAAAAGESEANRETRQKLKAIIQQLDFEKIPFKDVVEFIRNVSGCSIYVNWKALTLQGIDPSTEVTVHLTKVTVDKALATVLNDVGGTNPLQYILDEGVITISTREDLARRVTTRVYDIRHLLFRVPNFVGPRIDLANQNVGNNNQQAATAWGGGFGQQNANNMGEDNMPTKSEMIQALIDLITNTIDPPSWAGDAGIREMHGQLVVTQTAQNHQALAKLLDQLREAHGMQVSIEARFISVSTGFLNSIGVDLDFYFNMGSTLGGGGMVTDPFTGAQIPAVGPSGWQTTGHDPPGGTSFTPIGVTRGPGQRQRNFGSILGTSVNTGVSAGILSSISSPALSVAGVFLDDVQVDFLLEATQAHSATRTLNAPRITVWNGQRSYVTVATQTAYISGYTAVASTGEGGEAITVPNVSFVPTGVTLDVEATVSHDRKYVYLTVRPQVSQLQGAIVTVPTPAGNIGLPIVAVQDLQTTVMVPDGGTLLLGG
jgi:general secretion pathway protein D